MRCGQCTECARALGPSSLVAGDVLPGLPRYLPTAQMQALATASTQIHLRTAGNVARSATSVANTAPIERLRLGQTLVHTDGGWSAAEWTGPLATAAYMQVTGCAPGVGAYPNLYHACGNEGGLHLVAGNSVWTWLSPNEPMEAYLR